jgi:PilZ domain
MPRCPLAVPVRITVLRPGNAYSIPGRSLDLGEGGIAAVLAGELHAGDPVGIEFLLPDLGLGLQARGVVRHHGPLRCGFEFQQLTRHQQSLLHEWTRLMLGGEPRQTRPSEDAPEEEKPASSIFLRRFLHGLQPFRRALWWVAAVLLLAALAAWWNWESQWREIEREIPTSAAAMSPAATTQSALHT